jgi:hypothetical protein
MQYWYKFVDDVWGIEVYVLCISFPMSKVKQILGKSHGACCCSNVSTYEEASKKYKWRIIQFSNTLLHVASINGVR